MKIVPIANTIFGNEKAWGLGEMHEQSPGSRGFHRYQVITVLRDGELAEFRKDLGLASLYKGINPIAIPSLWEHTVDELFFLADQLRGQSQIDVKDFLSLESFKPA